MLEFVLDGGLNELEARAGTPWRACGWRRARCVNCACARCYVSDLIFRSCDLKKDVLMHAARDVNVVAQG